MSSTLRNNTNQPEFSDYFNGKIVSFLLYSIGWVIFSLLAAYPDFMLKFDLGMFQTATRDDFCWKFLTPILLFLIIFIVEFVFNISGTEIDKRKGELLRWVFILLSAFLFLFFAMIHVSYLPLKIGLFLVMWTSMVLIKGITIILPENEIIEVTIPQKIS